MAEETFIMLRRQQAQTQFDHVRVGGAKLETVLSFVYLGSTKVVAVCRAPTFCSYTRVPR